jgi:hypothetical protein
MAHTVIDQPHPAQPLATEKVNFAATSVVPALVAITVVSLVVCVVSFTTRHIDAGVSAASLCLLAAGASLAYRWQMYVGSANVSATGAASHLELAACSRPHSSAARLHTDSRTSDVIILATSFPIGPFSSPPPRSADS